MRRFRGEITVFLSLILVCVLSLFIGLLESARTVSARLYLDMAASSAVSSVMACYNRNFWDMYQILALEYESPEAITETFQEYINFYLEQKNLYPMQLESAEIQSLVLLTDDGAAPLEKEILSYIKYRLPDVAENISGITEGAAQAAKAGDFKTLLTVSRKAGKDTRRLEKKRQAIENSLITMSDLKKEAVRAAGQEKERSLKKEIKRLTAEIKGFPKLVRAYEAELEAFRKKRGEIDLPEGGMPEDERARSVLFEEQAAYGQVEEAAEEFLTKYQEMEENLEISRQQAEDVLELLDEGGEEDEETGEEEPDWDVIVLKLEKVWLPEHEETPAVDQEKSDALDRLTELFEKELLSFVVPDGTEISGKRLTGSDMPSASVTAAGNDNEKADPLKQFLINEYIFLYFDGFTKKHGGPALPADRYLSYEQEYILCGREGDRENLSGTVERLLAVRGAMNLLYLLSSPDKKAQADGLAAAVAGGNLPVQVLVSFLVLSLWAFGEAVVDVRALLAKENVMLWKTDTTWTLDLDGLLTMEFLDGSSKGNGRLSKGNDYEDYLRILYFLEKRQTRNFRMLDLMQGNVRTVQPDFTVETCAYELSLEASVWQRHLFFGQSTYKSCVLAEGGY